MEFKPLKKAEEIEYQKALIAKFERMIFRNPFDKNASKKLDLARKHLVKLIKDYMIKH